MSVALLSKSSRVSCPCWVRRQRIPVPSMLHHRLEASSSTSRLAAPGPLTNFQVGPNGSLAAIGSVLFLGQSAAKASWHSRARRCD